MDKQLKTYLTNLLPTDDSWITDLKEQASRDQVPIMDPLGMNFVMQLVKISKPTNILEIGTAIGYSALQMLEAHPASRIVTIEKDNTRFQQAIDNVTKYDLSSKINVIHGDAIDVMEKMVCEKQTFDFIFIDAAKGQYKRFFEIASSLLEDNGLIISDNVLFRGYVTDPTFDHKRYKNMVMKIRAFNEWLAQHPEFTSTFVPIGDGIAVSYKKSIERGPGFDA